MADGSPIGVAVVGLGFMGRTHLASLSRTPGCDVVAVFDRDPDRLSIGPEPEGNMDVDMSGVDLNSMRRYDDLRLMLADPDVDLVSVTTPTPTHAEIARLVIASGRHLLVEKPVDLDRSVIEELADLSRRAGILAMPAHCMRFWPAWRWMKMQLDDATFGRCLRASFRRVGAAPSWNSDFYLDESKSGGAAVDLHIHDTDFIVHCFGIPDSVSSRGTRRHIRSVYHYGDGPRVEAEGGWLEDSDVTFTMRATLECEHATMTFELGRDPEVWVTDRLGIETPRPEASDGGTGYDVQILEMIASIGRGDERPPVSLDDAVQTARVLAAELLSLERGGEDRIP